MNRLYILILHLIIILISTAASALPPVVIDNTLTKKNIGFYIEYLEDKDKKYTFNDIKKENSEYKWINSMSENLGFGFTDSAFWVRFKIMNNSNKDMEFFLEQAYPLIDTLRFYSPENSKYQIIETGDNKPFSQRPIENRTFIFPIKSGPKSLDTYYLYYKTSGSMNIFLNLYSPAQFYKSSHMEYILLALFYGIVLVMILYNLILFIFVRFLWYLYYSFAVFFIALFFMGLDGTSFQFLWPNSPGWANFSLPVFLNLMLLFVLLFVIELLGLKSLKGRKKYLKIIYLTLQGFVYTFFIIFIMSLFLPALTIFTISAIFAGLSLTCIGISLIVLIVSEKSRTALFSIIATLSVIIGAIATALRLYGAIPTTFLTHWSVHIGISLMVILFSIALADRINILRKEKDEAQQETINQLKRVDRLKDEFLSNISHEMNTPVANILLNSEMIKEGDLEESELPGAVDELYKNANRLSQLINSQILVSKLEAGEIDPSYNSASLNSIIDEAIDFFDKTGIYDGHNIIKPLDDIDIYTDRDLLKTMLMELLENSIIYSEPGKDIRVEVLNEKGSITITVKDSGKGIPENSLSSVMDKFSRLDTSITYEKSGTGLGLYLCGRIAVLLQGRLSLRNRKEGGLEVTIILPAKPKNHI